MIAQYLFSFWSFCLGGYNLRPYQFDSKLQKFLESLAIALQICKRVISRAVGTRRLIYIFKSKSRAILFAVIWNPASSSALAAVDQVIVPQAVAVSFAAYVFLIYFHRPPILKYHFNYIT